MSILFAISNVSGKSCPTIYKGQFKTILRFGQEETVTYLLHCFQLKNFIDEIMASANVSLDIPEALITTFRKRVQDVPLHFDHANVLI